MRWWVTLCFFGLAACGNDPAEKTSSDKTSDSTTSAKPELNQLDTTISFAKDTASYQSYSPTIKKPSGIYQFLAPYDGNTKILHTVAFYPTSFRLQEEYPGKKDSTVVTEGTWAPSQGFIWLYKEQLVRGRYTWKGDTLQYFSPRLNKKFSLTRLTPASNNKVWMDKKNQGTILFGVGNEPFWSVEITKKDSIVLSMPDWTEPLRVKISTANKAAQQTVYTAATDSLQVTVLPHFCNDGMSDFIYSNKVTVNYKGKTYQGCAMSF
ncbi:MAG TPA: hypothetical protein VER36_10265 [Flavisolibacter sp.]|nr:hypothetical protein [Flavisolibacter sp.]